METNNPLESMSYIDEIGKKLIHLQSQGFLILQDDLQPINLIEQKGFSDEFGLSLDNIVYYSSNPNIDNGYYSSKEELEQILSKIKIVNPKDIISISSI